MIITPFLPSTLTKNTKIITPQNPGDPREKKFNLPNPEGQKIPPKEMRNCKPYFHSTGGPRLV